MRQFNRKWCDFEQLSELWSTNAPTLRSAAKEFDISIKDNNTIVASQINYHKVKFYEKGVRKGGLKSYLDAKFSLNLNAGTRLNVIIKSLSCKELRNAGYKQQTIAVLLGTSSSSIGYLLNNFEEDIISVALEPVVKKILIEWIEGLRK